MTEAKHSENSDLPLAERVRRFNLGTPTPMHQGTHDLVNDLWSELDRLLTLERECVKLVRAVRATEDHREWFGPIAAIMSLIPDGEQPQGETS